MTKEQRQRTEFLRNVGRSYRSIASELNVPLATVQSYCRSKGLTGDRSDSKGSYCPVCGKELIQEESKKKRRFCSDKCRQKWWYENREKMKRKKTVKIVCLCCKATFESYKGSNRKYCSIDCYINDRFGKEGISNGESKQTV